MSRILIVEDEVIIAKDLESKLKGYSYTVTAIAVTGREALDAIEAARPDLVIMDIEMPGDMDGIETAARIKAEYGIPVIYLTAYSNDSLIRRARETGPHGYILKPYRPDELRIAIEMALSRHEMEKRVGEANRRLEQEVDDHRRTGMKLKKSEERYRRISNSITDYIYNVLIEDGSAIRSVHSEYCAKITGYSAGELDADQDLRLKMVHPDDRGMVTARAESVAKGGDFEPWEHRIIRKDGLVRWVRNTPVPKFNERGDVLEYDGVVQDITERKLAEEALRESEEQYREFVEGAGVIVLKMDASGNVMFLNDYGERFFGYVKEEIMGKNVVGTIVPESESTGRDLGALIAEIVADPERFRDNENENITSAGRRVWVRWSNKAMIDETGRLAGILSIGIDNTPRKFAEDALNESQARYLSLFNNSIEMVVVADLNGAVIDANRYALDILGYTREDIGRITFPDLFDNDDLSRILEVVKKLIKTGKEKGIHEYRLKKKNGEIITIETLSSVIFRRDKPMAILFIARDVTARKLGEEALRNSNEQLAATLNALPDIMFEIDGNGRILDFRTPHSDVLYVTPEQFLGKTVSEILPEEPARVINRAIAEATANGRHQGAVYSLLMPGGVYWFELSIAAQGDPRSPNFRLVVLARDITKRKSAEDALRVSEEKFSKMFMFSPVSLGLTRLSDGRYIDINETFTKLTGYAREEVIDKSSLDLNIWVDPSDRVRVRDSVSSKGMVLREQVRLRIKSGSVITVMFSAVHINMEGVPCLISAAEDITDRLRAESEVRKSREDLQYMFDGTPIMMCVVDRDRKVLRGNRAFKEACGWSETESGSGLACGVLGCVNSHDDPRGCGYGKDCGSCTLSLTIEDTFRDGIERTGVERKLAIIRKGRETDFYFLGSTTLLPLDESPMVLLCLQDITERKMAEEKAISERNRAQEYLDVAGVIFIAIDVKGDVILVNKKGSSILGYDESELIGRNWFDLFVPLRMRNDVKSVFDKLISGEIEPVEYYENEILTRSGEEKIVAWHNTLVRDSKGAIIGTLSSGEDITERKKFETALRQSEEKYRMVADHTYDWEYWNDPGGEFLYISPSCMDVTGYEQVEFIREPRLMETIVYPVDSERFARHIHKMRHGEQDACDTYRIITKGGELRWIGHRCKHVFSESGQFLGVRGSNRDITSRIKAEEALAESEAKYREIVENAPIGIFRRELGGKFQYVNPGLIQQLECKTEKELLDNYGLISQRWVCLERSDEFNALLLKNGRVYGYETETRLVNGTTKWFTLYAFLDDTNQIINGFSLDITTSVKAEEALAESEEKFRSLFADSGDAQILLDGNLILDCNVAAMRMMRCAVRDEVVGQLLQKFCPDIQPDGQQSLVKRGGIAKRALEEKSVRFEWQHRRADGELFYAETVLTSVVIEGKALLHATLRDITDRKLLQEQIINIVDIEQQRLGRNLHDGLGQDLTGVAFLCNSLTKRLKELALPEAARSEEVTRHVYRVITAVRTLSRELYPPNLVENEISFTLADFAANVEKMFGITCVYEQDADLAVSNINASTQIYYVAREAVNNAIRHGNARNILITLTREEDRVTLMIKNDGAGLPGTIDQKMGLGLRIMAYRMESIHGSFGIRLNPDGRTVVTCSVPMHVIRGEV